MSDGNAGQIDYWNNAPGQRWVTHDTELDALHAPVTERLLARADLKQGDRVLDIGCGAGATCVAIAEHVGTKGSVVGVDVSSPLLLRAARRIEMQKMRNIELARADAQSHAFETGAFDLAVSRFGTMFFADPVLAFANIASALRPGAPIVFAAWAGADVNPWFALPIKAAEAQVGSAPPDPPGAPGPMAFRDAPRVIALLAAAGLTEIAAERADLELTLPGGPEAAAKLAIHIGPAARLLRIKNGTETDRMKIVDALTRDFDRLADGNVFRVPAAVYLFSARVAAPARSTP